MSLKYVDTSGFTAAAEATSTAIEAYNDALDRMVKATDVILDSWVGKGRDEFQTQVTLIKGKLGDISDELYDLYNALVDAEKTFIDADQAAAKQISIDGN